MKIFYLDKHHVSITGGHKYNDAFENYLEEYSQNKIMNEPQLSVLYPGSSKLYAPLAEIKRISKFHKGDVVFWGDTSYKYHLFLLWVTRIFRSTKNVCIVHHFPWLDKSGIVSWLEKQVMNIYYSLMDYIIVPSPYTKAVAEECFPQKEIVYIPLPFENKFEPSLDYEVGRLLFVGTIEPRKGLAYLVRAMKLFESKSPLRLKLDVVGKVVDDSYKNQLDEYIKAHNLDVTFLGRVSDETLDACYRKAEVFVFPSLLEGYGIVLVEAMQRGLPIVCFNNSAMPYSISDGVNGYLANDKDCEDFANKLLEICNAPHNRAKIQQGMKSTINQIKTLEDFKKEIRCFWRRIDNSPQEC